MNLQNIPRQDKTIKKAFRPKLDAFLFFDYMQIELRLLAYYMACLGDDSMAEVFKEDKDLHAESAVGAFQLDRPPTDKERQLGKNLNFSMVYGGGRPAVMRYLDAQWEPGEPKPTWEYAGVILKNFHARWPGIGIVTRMLEETLQTRGYIKTLWGRHLHPDSPHKALNALVQGCAADLMKAGLVKTHRWIREQELKSHLVLTIHDELVIDAERTEIPILAESVPELMSHEPVDRVVPIGADCEISWETWADKTSYKEFVERALAA